MTEVVYEWMNVWSNEYKSGENMAVDGWVGE
jgi:hypothetical protein